jgi:hypothetical protein
MNQSLRNNAVERKSSKQMIVENKTTTRPALQPGLTLPVNKNIYQALDISQGIENLLKESDSPLRFIDDTPTPTDSLYDTICNLPRVLDVADLERMDQGSVASAQLRNNNRPKTVKSVKRRSRSMSRNRLSREQNNEIYSHELENNHSEDVNKNVELSSKSLENIYKTSNKKHVSFLEDESILNLETKEIYERNNIMKTIQDPSNPVVPVPILSPPTSRKSKQRPLPPPRQISSERSSQNLLNSSFDVLKSVNPQFDLNTLMYHKNVNNFSALPSTLIPAQPNQSPSLNNRLSLTTSCFTGTKEQLSCSSTYSRTQQQPLNCLPSYSGGIQKNNPSTSCYSYHNQGSSTSGYHQVSKNNQPPGFYYAGLQDPQSMNYPQASNSLCLPAVSLSRSYCTCDNRGSSDSGLADISLHRDTCPLSIQASGSRLHPFSTSSPIIARKVDETQPRRVQSQLIQPASTVNTQSSQLHASVPELRPGQPGTRPYSQGVISPVLTRKYPLRYPGQQNLYNQAGSLDVIPGSGLQTPVEDDFQPVSMGNLFNFHSYSTPQSRSLSEFQTFRPTTETGRENSLYSQDSSAGGSSKRESNNLSSISCSSYDYSSGVPSPLNSPVMPRTTSWSQNNNNENVYYTEQTFIQHDMNMNQIKPQPQPQYKTGLYAHWLMNASLQPIKEECHEQHSLPSI